MIRFAITKSREDLYGPKSRLQKKSNLLISTSFTKGAEDPLYSQIYRETVPPGEAFSFTGLLSVPHSFWLMQLQIKEEKEKEHMSIYRDGYEHGKLLYAERPYISTLAVMNETLMMSSRLNLPIEQHANYRDGVLAGFDCEKRRVELAAMQRKLRGREHDESPGDIIRKICILRAQIYVYEQGDIKDTEKEKEYE